MFIVVYALDWSNETQWLGLCLGGALGPDRRGADRGRREADRRPSSSRRTTPTPSDLEEQEKVDQIVEESGSRLTRRRLLLGGAGRAPGAALGAALVVPAASLGPVLDTALLYETPW